MILFPRSENIIYKIRNHSKWASSKLRFVLQSLNLLLGDIILRKKKKKEITILCLTHLPKT